MSSLHHISGIYTSICFEEIESSAEGLKSVEIQIENAMLSKIVERLVRLLCDLFILLFSLYHFHSLFSLTHSSLHLEG